jgi:hypothetical protein
MEAMKKAAQEAASVAVPVNPRDDRLLVLAEKNVEHQRADRLTLGSQAVVERRELRQHQLDMAKLMMKQATAQNDWQQPWTQPWNSQSWNSQPRHGDWGDDDPQQLQLPAPAAIPGDDGLAVL